MSIQALVDAWAEERRKQRAETQMTLGKMIASLEKMNQSAEIDGIEKPHSYRGYCSDLAFHKKQEKSTVADALAMCKSAMGRTYEGYKGGDYIMHENTPLWLANYGQCGVKIIAIHADGTLETAEDD